jgi:DNA invertase Pin-like site-specific DNA recombinase
MAQNQRVPPNAGLILAAKYVRMSTEHQQYSIDNQSDAISRYAREHNMEIVRTYTDSGKSGLTIQHRPGLRQLIADVEGGSPGYAAILVYDVSRWGRFQDVDESAYYEYQCRRAKVALHYCAEAFSNDGSALAALVKTLKRTMAAEYSRELSAKVFAGQSRLTELGFRQGGTAGYGLRRLLVDHGRKPKLVLHRGEEKSIATDRVVLTPGPPEEIEIVKEVFHLYGEQGCGPKEIAEMLNRRGAHGEGGRPWTRHIIRRMVTNPKYIGANVTNRQSAKLRGRHVRNPPEMWVRKDNAFEAIVDTELFKKAEEAAATRSQFLTDEQLLEHLGQLLRKHGKISERLIRASLGMPSTHVYTARFGGLAEAYKRVGFQPRRNLAYVDRDRALTPIRREFIARVVGALKSFGASVEQDTRGQYLTVNENLNMRVCITRCRAFKRFDSWRLQLCSPWTPDVSIFARLAPGNESILDYFCVPASKELRTQITVSPQTPPPRDVQRFNDLGFLQDFATWGQRGRKPPTLCEHLKTYRPIRRR